MSEPMKVPDRETRTADVVGSDVRRLGSGNVEVDSDEGDVRLDELLDLGIVAVDAHEHDAVDMVVASPPEIRVSAVAVRGRLLGREEQDVIAVRADSVLHADEDVLEERVADVGMLAAREKDDADQLRAAPHERAGGGARCVVERARSRENTLLRRGAHVAVAVEDSRDSGYRDAATFGYFTDGARFDLRKRFRWSDANASGSESQEAIYPYFMRYIGTRWFRNRFRSKRLHRRCARSFDLRGSAP
jgi:hypothetical protein